MPKVYQQYRREMEQTVLFEEKVYLSPKDMNQLVTDTALDALLMRHLREKLENKCSQHGFVIPGSLKQISRSMGQLENGRFTGNITFHVQAQGKVYYPVNGTRITGTILKKNKMGLYVIYKNAIRILVPRDLHIGSTDFEDLGEGDIIEVEIRKSRFQIRDPFILCIGVYVGPADTEDVVKPPPATDAPAAAAGEAAAKPLAAARPNFEEAKAESDEDDGLLPNLNTAVSGRGAAAAASPAVEDLD